MRSRSIPVLRNGAKWLITLAFVSLSGSVYASPDAASSASALRRATAIHVQNDVASGRSEVAVAFSAVPKFTARYERQAKRLIIDVADAEAALSEPTLLNKDGVVAGVLTQTYDGESGKIVRIFVSLRTDAAYSIATRDKSLVVSFATGDASAQSGPKAGTSGATVLASPVTTIARVDFEATRLVDRVVLEFDRFPKY